MTGTRLRARRVGAACAALLTIALCIALPALGQSTEPPIPDYVGYMNDVAGVVSEPMRAKLEAFLDQVHTKTGAQFAVLTLKNTAPVSPTEYKVKVFEKWGIGDKERDDGLLMLVALDEREVRFETGYGLEGTLPDGLQSRIFRQYMAPSFRNGDFESGIRDGVLQCAVRIAAEKGVTLEWDGKELRYRERKEGLPKGMAVALLVLFILFVVSRSINSGGPGGRRRRSSWLDMAGWGAGGLGGLGGGWSGGGFGGSSGGGGGSFGGFGGGSSGGGGGGGSW